MISRPRGGLYTLGGRLRELLKTYDPGSVWYKADILGLRTAASGRIYTGFGPQCLIDAVVADPRRGIDKSFFFHTLIICQILSFPCFFIFEEY